MEFHDIESALAVVISVGTLLFNSGKKYSQDVSRVELLLSTKMEGVGNSLNTIMVSLAGLPDALMQRVAEKFVSIDRHEAMYDALADRISKLEREK